MKPGTWQLAIFCILIAIVIFQGVLIQNLNTQLVDIQTTTAQLHSETIAKLNQLLADNARLEAQVRALVARR